MVGSCEPIDKHLGSGSVELVSYLYLTHTFILSIFLPLNEEKLQ
jgi:hypothetical protein